MPTETVYQGKPCTGCGTPVVWLKNNVTKLIAPIEAEESEEGNCVILPGNPTLYARVKTADQKSLFDDPEFPELPRHFNHFARCPKAEAFRQRDPVGRQSQKRRR